MPDQTIDPDVVRTSTRETVTFDVGDQDTFTVLVGALEDRVADLRDDIAARADLFGEDAITVERLRCELATAERLLSQVLEA